MILTDLHVNRATEIMERSLVDQHGGRVLQRAQGRVVVAISSRLAFWSYWLFGTRGIAPLPAVIGVCAFEEDGSRLKVEMASDQGSSMPRLLPRVQRVYRRQFDEMAADLRDVVDGQIQGGALTRLRPPA